MEKENTAQAEPAGNGAEAQREESAPGGFGKFKSADALLNAYNSLEAEFTRRSQRLRELEGRENCAQPRGESAPAAEGDAAIEEKIERAVERAIAARAPYVMAEGGGYAAAPPQRAKTVEEAGALARELFRKGRQQ